MKWIGYLLFACLLAGCGERGATSAGDALDLESLSGRWVIINYWAEWCTPCIKEIPELNALAERYPQLAVFGVNFDGATGAALKAQEEALGVAFPTLGTDPGPQLGVARPQVLPTTLVLDPEGRLVHNLVGPQTVESLVLATGQAGMEPPEAEADALPHE